MIVSQFAPFMLLAASGEPNPLDLKSDLALWTAVVFLVLLAVLWKFAWKPLAKGLDNREKLIADQISEAEQTNQQARQLLADYQQKLADFEAGGARHSRSGPPRGGKTRPGVARPGQERDPGRAQRSLQQIEAATAGRLQELARAEPRWPSTWPARSSAAGSTPTTTPS